MLLCLGPQSSQPQQAVAFMWIRKELECTEIFFSLKLCDKIKHMCCIETFRQTIFLSGQAKIALLACICVSFCLVFGIWQLHFNMSLQCVLGTSWEVRSTEGILNLKNRKGRKYRSHFNCFKKSWDYPHSLFFMFNVKSKTFIIIMGILQPPS